jgi:hypothetical protein
MNNCCDNYCANYGCNQGRDCPARVARIGQRMKTANPLPPSIWREQLKRLGYWMLMAVIGLTVWLVFLATCVYVYST